MSVKWLQKIDHTAGLVTVSVCPIPRRCQPKEDTHGINLFRTFGVYREQANKETNTLNYI